MKTANTHKCPAPECTQRVGYHMFACRRDWFRLPKEIRDAIEAGFYTERLGEQHTAAMAEAVEWYAENPLPGTENNTSG